MTTKDVYTSKKLDLKICNFTKPDLLDGFRKSSITINNLKHIVLQSPKLHIKSVNDNYVELIINRNRENSREFYNVISHLEDMIITTTSQNSEEWFGKKISTDYIESMFKSCIKCPLEIDDYFIIKIRKNKEVILDLNFPVICIIKIYGIVFGKSSSMIDMKICHAKIMKNEEDNKIHETKMMYYDDGNSISHSIFTNVEKRRIEKQSVPYQTDTKSVPIPVPDKTDVSVPVPVSVPSDVKSILVPVPVPVQTDVKTVPEDIKSVLISADVKTVPVSEDVKLEAKSISDIKKEEHIDIETVKCDYMTASIKNDEESMSKARAYIEKNDKNMYKLENDNSDEDCGIE